MNATGNIIWNCPKVEQPKCPPTGGWTNKMWYIHITEHYLAIKMNELLPLHGITSYDMEEPQKQRKKRKKPDPRGHILYHSIYIACLEKANL